MGNRELRRLPKTSSPQLKAFATTGCATQADKSTLREEGFLAIIQKPFNLADLTQLVRQTLDST